MALLRQYNYLGEKQWSHQFGTSLGDVGNSLAIDSSDNIFVAGLTHGKLDGANDFGMGDIFIRLAN